MYKHIKRIFDFSAALVMMLLLIPVYIGAYLLVLVFMGRPVLFTQKRIGKNERPFMIFKFRTLTNNIDKQKLSDNERLTGLGAFLRKFSIDELPQLFNILRGDMSFIGPRPLLEKYLPYYTEREKLRHQVRPGMGGLAQVSGRSFINWDEQFELDAIYVERLSFMLDLTIVLKTVYIVLFSKNMMVTGRVDKESFDVHRKKQLIIGNENPFNVTLSTERLVLRKLKMDDAQDMFEYTGNAEVTKFLSWKEHKSIEQTKLFIKNTLTEYDGVKSYPYSIELKSTQKFIGVLRAYDIDFGNKHCEISYILNPAFQGQGFMVEAINAFISHSFNELGFIRIQAKCMVNNESSEKLMKRVGMEFEGVLKSNWIYKGKILDAKLFAITKSAV